MSLDCGRKLEFVETPTQKRSEAWRLTKQPSCSEATVLRTAAQRGQIVTGRATGAKSKKSTQPTSLSFGHCVNELCHEKTKLQMSQPLLVLIPRYNFIDLSAAWERQFKLSRLNPYFCSRQSNPSNTLPWLNSFLFSPSVHFVFSCSFFKTPLIAVKCEGSLS